VRRVAAPGAWAVLGTLGLLVAVAVPELGSDPWPFHPPFVHPHAVLGFVVRAADRHWDLGFIRTPGSVAGMLVAVAALIGWRRREIVATIPMMPRPRSAKMMEGLCSVRSCSIVSAASACRSAPEITRPFGVVKRSPSSIAVPPMSAFLPLSWSMAAGSPRRISA